MLNMSPTCCILLPGHTGQVSGLQFISNSFVDVTSSLVFSALAKQHAAAQPDPFEPLKQLSSIPRVERGTAAELIAYQTIVKAQIERAVAYLDGAEPILGLGEKLQKALRLVNQGKTSQGHAIAEEICGYAGLMGQAVLSGAQTSVGSSSSSLQFKVPALPAKRRSSDQLDSCRDVEQPQQQGCIQKEPARQQHKKHSAPKRRATPQVLPGAPFGITPAAPPASETHGETVCDANMLSSWCPISGKRQRVSEDMHDNGFSSGDNNNAAASSLAGGTASFTVQPSNCSGSIGSATNNNGASVPPPSATKQQLPPKPPVTGSAAVPRHSSNSSGRSAASAARAAAHAEAAEALTRLLHSEPSCSKPAAGVLLFNKSAQQPISNWTGTIKHKSGGRVVELCNVTLQVPEPFLEEFPRGLYAAEVRHRRAVSLGCHVVCRATLGTLSEHQLMGLSAMAKGQLVALCSLQTAELHLVPYFDNKNLVRVVGFLKAKAE